MRFHVDSEHQALQESVRGTLQDKLPPERITALIGQQTARENESWAALMELGLAAVAVPESQGGVGLGTVGLALVAESLGHGGALGSVGEHLLAARAIAQADERQVEAARPFFEQVLAGDVRATLAINLRDGDIGDGPTLAGSRLDGTVRFVVGGADADLFVVVTAAEEVVLVERGPGVVATGLPSGDRTRPLAKVSFADAPAILLASGGHTAEKLLDAALIQLAADALGGAQRCLDMAVVYAKERMQFGRPIATFQALKHQLATMALEIESARGLVWYAAYAHDRELLDARRSAALAKAHLADRYTSVARAAVAAHGAIGYTWEYPLNIWYHRSLFDFAHLGTPAQHRSRAAALAGW